MSSATIEYPRSSISCTTARPMPPAAPVTRATGAASVMSGYRPYLLASRVQDAVVAARQADLRHMQAVGVLPGWESPEQLGLVERQHAAGFAADPGQRVVDGVEPDRLTPGRGADGLQHAVAGQ